MSFRDGARFDRQPPAGVSTRRPPALELDKISAPVATAAKPRHVSSGVPVLELRNVTQRFGSQTVLRDVSISVERGETLVLIGESGCGKSVTLKLIMALLEPTEGAVYWNGRPVHERKERELVRERLRFGFLFQGAALFDSLTVYENVSFGLRHNTQLPEEQIRRIVHQHLREVGLRESVGEKKPADLSGGMKKRVALARALALDPEVILYDEPTTGLDPIMTDVINELILRTRNSRPVTSIVVTHEMRTVEKVADRVIMLYPLARLAPSASQIVFEGTADDAFASSDPRVAQFMAGSAGERIDEITMDK